jgi:lipoate-protein ligase A
MHYCDLSLSTPEENLACDEVLLELCEEGEAGETLRVWESARYFVVLGYASKYSNEVNEHFCQQNTIPILRRCTGGGTVLQGPGCLNYSLILRIEEGGPLNSIPATNDFILKRHRDALAALLGAHVEMQGQTDLAIGGLKFSGNSQRRRKHFLIFHGTFLLHLDISMVEKALLMPPRQPAYRGNRSHADFLMNVKVPAHALKEALTRAWGANEPPAEVPLERVTAFAQSKYSSADWNFKF